jgi:hypothetical protein
VDDAAGREEGVADHPVRRGAVDLLTRAGTRVHHDDAAVRYEPDAFVVAPGPDFDATDTERYAKADVAWVEVRHPRS